MKTTIDKAGRLVIPKSVREAAGLGPGTDVEFRVVDGRVEIAVAPIEVELEHFGGLLVAVPRHDTPPLTAEEVDDTIEQVRRSGED